MKVTVDGSSGPGTTVGVNVALSGTLKDQNDISVFGMVEGEVISEKAVTIGQSAQIKGPIRGQTVTVGGVVRGPIDAIEKIEILETGKVFGSITAKNLVVHSGAVLIGKCEMPTSESVTESEETKMAENDEKNEEIEPQDNESEEDKEKKEEEELLQPEVEEV